MAVTAVVFDLDGTLVDSSPDIAAALNTAFAEFGVRDLGPAEVLAMLGGGPRVLVQAALAAVGHEADGAELDALVETYSRAYRSHPVERTAFFADAEAGIRALRDRGLRLGVCTNKRTDIAELVLTHLGVRECFDSVFGTDRATRSKPAPDHLLETLAEIGVEPESCLYVGDTEIDARTAAAAGVRYAHVEWGHPIDAPGTTIRTFSELLPLVGEPV